MTEVEGGNAVQILILLAGVTLVPALLFPVTGFTRILIVLGFIRSGLGTPAAPPNQVLVGIALFLTQYAPRRVARPFAYVIDLLAAVPSIVYGLWGALVLAPFLLPAAQWLAENLGWFPLFSGQVSGTGRTILTAAIVLAVSEPAVISGSVAGAWARSAMGERSVTEQA